MIESPVPYRLGIDLGGTKILALVLDEQGTVLAQAKTKTKPEKGYDVVLNRIVKCAHEALEKALVSIDQPGLSCGLGVPGPVDETQGIVVKAANLGWDTQSVATDLSKRLQALPVAVGNDVNMGALAESELGAAAGSSSSAALFVGTGLGGALVHRREVLGGAHGLGGEIGHVPFPGGRFTCSCGQYGCVETAASKVGLIQFFRQAEKDGKTCSLTGKQKLGSSSIKAAFENGEELVQQALDESCAALAWAIGMLGCTFDPEVFVFGGGIMEELGEALLPKIYDHLGSFSFYRNTVQPDLRIASLGGQAAAIGAALLGGRHYDALS